MAEIEGWGIETVARQSGQDGVVRSHASTQAAWNAWRHAGSSRSSASSVNGDRQTAQSGELFGSAASEDAIVNSGSDSISRCFSSPSPTSFFPSGTP
uniref:Uncharacterized protein n=1 Tax=Oryza brachyantha TaxID=4533 RepID=J3M0T8_ORYBR